MANPTISSFSPANGSIVTTPKPVFTLIVAKNGYNFIYGVTPSAQVKLSKANPNPDIDPNMITSTYSPSGSAVTETFLLCRSTLPTASLTAGVWYYKVAFAYYDANYNVQFLTQTGSFTVQVIPEAYSPGSPAGAIATEASPLFSWTFGSSDPDDYMTAYQILVQNAAGTTTHVDSGKVASASQGAGTMFANLAISSTFKHQDLTWKVRVWNKSDNVSAYTFATAFRMVDAPTLSITAPTEAQAVTTGTPSVTFTPTFYDSGVGSLANVQLWQGGTIVWQKSLVQSLPSGTPQTVSDGNFVLTNLTPYTYRVTVKDSRGVSSADTVRNFTTNYTLPPTPSGGLTVSTSAHDTSGYIQLTWNATTRDTDFLAWLIERRDNMVNPDTGGIVETTAWQTIGRSYGTAAATTWRDFLAPIGYQSEYRVRQIALRFGAEILSTSGITGNASYLATGMYWLVGGANGDSATAVAIRLWNVTDDQLTDETERAEFNLIGRGRYVEKGTNFGVRGQLTLKLRNGDALMARQKRRLLEGYKNAYNVGWLRNPFGDIYPVNIGDMSISRIAGTGMQEFADVTIPYVEVVS